MLMKQPNINSTKYAVVLLVLGFFLPGLIMTIESASPYCRADDWRFVEIYLRPYLDGTLQLQDLWSDPVHPLPLYAFMFICSAEWSNLQIHQIGWVCIFFQFFYALLIVWGFMQSTEQTGRKNGLLLLSIVGICTVIFSFVVNTAYTWPIMSSLYGGLFLLVAISMLANSYLNRARKKLKLVFLAGVYILTTLLYSDWAILLFLSFLIAGGILLIIEKQNRRKILLLSVVSILSIVAGLGLLNLLTGESSRQYQSAINALIILFVDHFILTFKAIATGLFSGLLNYTRFTTDLGLGKNLYIMASAVFMVLYLGVLVLYFIKRLYNRTILPCLMMIFSLLFLLSALVFRYNPLDHGSLALVIGRYLIYYQVGIAGFFWAVYMFLIRGSRSGSKSKNAYKISLYILTFILFSIWVYHFSAELKTAKFLKSKYPEVSEQIRAKRINPEIKAPWSNQPGRDISKQLDLLHEYQLNVFAPNYPYPPEKEAGSKKTNKDGN